MFTNSIQPKANAYEQGVRNSYPTSMKSREVDVSSKLTFNPKQRRRRRRSSITRRRPTKHYFNSTSFNLRIKHIFPNLGLGNFLKWKRRRVGEDEEELTNGFSLILEQEFGVCKWN